MELASRPSFLEFWGKARPAGEEGIGDVLFHPVAYHSLDVAACVQQILEVRPLAREAASRLLRADATVACRFLTALSALHDVGKFASCFQAKRADLWPAALGAVPLELPRTFHTRDGFCLWDESLRNQIGPALWDGDIHDLTPIVQAVMGHHGRPVAIDRRRDMVSSIFLPAGQKAAEKFSAAAVKLLADGPMPCQAITERDAYRATWWIAGLITVADWIGSNERRFPYTQVIAGDPGLNAYWEIAQQRAAVAVHDAGLKAPKAARHRTFSDLTGCDAPPTPLQRWASELQLPDGPTLFILEDVTGAGKTEAAQILIHRLMATGRASGAFWAMPTQATANAMYGRQAKSLHALFEDVALEQPSLVLAHGQARMHENFRQTVIDAPGPGIGSKNANADDAPSEVACPTFLASSSRTALIADVGSGTIDQALLAVLPSKFNTIRLFGLAEKVLVLDEIHAYDSYMIEELRALLRFHGELGGSVVALTATLPAKLAADLVDEWRHAVARNFTATSEPVPATSAYPLVTTVDGKGALSRDAVASAAWSRRRVPVTLVHDRDRVIERLLAAARAGAAAVWVRNTIDSCREAAAILRERGAERVSVFHARFAQVDRQRREAEVQRRFGKEANCDRAGSILLATQVVEQSLDIDFDVMVSDLAPVDLLVQRSGRLWRHAFRDAGRPIVAPDLMVLAPPYQDTPEKNWLDELLPGTKFVYPDAGLLWRTLRTLNNVGRIDTPDGLRDLIESVYGSDECPANLDPATARARGAASAATATARQYTLRIGEGYVGESLIWSSDVRVPTRLGEPQTTLRIGRVLPDGAVRPWAEDGESALPLWHRWALSEVRVSARRIPWESQPEPSLQRACDAARIEWGKWEQPLPLLPLSRTDGSWRGAMICEGKRITVGYDTEDGLSFL